MARSTPRQALLIARTELRRSVRNARPDSNYGLVALAGGALLYVGYGVGGGVIGYLLGRMLGGDLPAFVGPVIGLSGTAVFAFIALMALQRTAKQIGTIDHADAMLTRVSVPAVVGGLVVAETGRYLGFVALPVIGLAVGLGIGSGLVTVGLAVLAVVALVVASAVAVGYAGGMAVRLAVARSATLARHKTAVGVTTTLATLGVYGVLTARPPTAVFLALGRATPLGWVGHPVALAIPGIRADPLTAAAGLLLPVGLAAGALPVASWLARRRWFTAAVDPAPKSTPTGGSTASTTAVLQRLPGVPASAAAVARTHLRRARRAPFTVQYAVVPFFFLIYQVQYVVRTGTVSPTLPVVLGLIVPWSAGAAFSLNPLGEQGPVLGHVLLGAAPTRNVVVGTGLAGWLIGLPALLVVPTTGVLVGWTPLELAVLTVVALGLLAAAPPMAAAVGVAAPKFEPTTLGSDREAIVPSAWAFMGFALGYGIVVLPIYLGAQPLVIDVLADATGLGARPLFFGGAAITLGLAAVAGVAGRWFAVRRLDAYRRV